MLVEYDGYTIYHVYLPNEEKVICIKDLKIVENVDRKVDSQLTSYNVITTSQDDITSNIPISSLYVKHSSSSLYAAQLCFPSYTQTKSGRISKPPKRYDEDRNNNIQIFFSQLTKVLNILN